MKTYYNLVLALFGVSSISASIHDKIYVNQVGKMTLSPAHHWENENEIINPNLNKNLDIPICDMALYGEPTFIGNGKEGKVFEILQITDQKPFAMKKLPKAFLLQEIEILSRIKGLGITADIVCADLDQSFFIMEKVNGVTLAEVDKEYLLQVPHPHSIARYSSQQQNKDLMNQYLHFFANQMFHILKTLHLENIYHLDIHWKNWMVEHDTLKLVLIDFGSGDASSKNQQLYYNTDIMHTIISLKRWCEKMKLEEEDLEPSYREIFDLYAPAPNIETILSMLK